MWPRWNLSREGPGRTTLALSFVVVIVLVVPTYAYGTRAGATFTPGAFTMRNYDTHINHTIFVVLENHAFDSVFGGYCPTAGTYCSTAVNGDSTAGCIPYNPANPTGPCVAPFANTAANESIWGALPHNWDSTHQAYDNGSMDDFYLAEHSHLQPFGYGSNVTSPTWFDLAEQYGLGENFFSSVLSYTLPNHWHIVAGQAPQIILQNFTQDRPKNKANVTIDHTYLNEANQTKSVEDLLINSSVSWDYYDETLGSYAQAISLNSTKVGIAYQYKNPLAAKAESYNSTFTKHFVPSSQFFSDAKNGTLPQLSWVIPPGPFSDHPPRNTTLAQSYIASVVDAVEASPDWNSTAMFITWDDYGGFYDQVAPPTINGTQVGFRVPLIVVSPYAKEGYVSSTPTYFESILALMESRYNQGCITTTDCTAPLPLDYFYFGQPPRAPLHFPTNFSLATYPMPLQHQLGVYVPVPPFQVSQEILDNSTGGGSED